MSKALLVEDDEDNLFLFKTALEGSFSEIDILSHNNFTDAKKSFDAHQEEIRVIISDHLVGNEDSEMFFDFIQERDPKIPIILVSAGIPKSIEYLEKVKKSEIHCFWQKPIPVEEIEEYIKMILC